VTIIAHTNNVKYSNLKTNLIFPFIQVVIKLIDPKIEETPAICNLKIAKSIDPPK